LDRDGIRRKIIIYMVVLVLSFFCKQMLEKSELLRIVSEIGKMADKIIMAKIVLK
jgi:hypothetical protein